MSALSILFNVILAIWVVWAIWITLFLKRAFRDNLDYLLRPKMSYLQKCPPATRYDAGNINKTEIHLGAIFLLPIRFISGAVLMLICFAYIYVLKTIYKVDIKNSNDPRGQTYIQLIKFIFFLIKPMFWLFGFTSFKNTKISIFDYFGDYEPVQDTSVAPIVISNHSSWQDMFFYLQYPVSFLSKAEVAKTFFVGMFAIAKQCIFVNRSCTKDREAIMGLIKQRVDRVMSQNDIPPVLIFPEGTVSHGRSLIKFKKGAFVLNKPIKIFALRYGGNGFISSISNVHPLIAIIFSLSQLNNSLELLEVEENLDPRWIERKHNLVKGGEENWQVVADEVKRFMLFLTGYQNSELGFRDMRNYEDLEFNRKVNFNFGFKDREGPYKPINLELKKAKRRESREKVGGDLKERMEDVVEGGENFKEDELKKEKEE